MEKHSGLEFRKETQATDIDLGSICLYMVIELWKEEEVKWKEEEKVSWEYQHIESFLEDWD